jgi:hypothetical protein
VPDPHPWTLAYFHVSLLLVQITTLLLLRLSPMVRLTRATFFSFALMLGVWAAWALAGFGYPSAPLPIALNIASKLLAFVTAFTLFAPQQPAPSPTTTSKPTRRPLPGAKIPGSLVWCGVSLARDSRTGPGGLCCGSYGAVGAMVPWELWREPLAC